MIQLRSLSSNSTQTFSLTAIIDTALCVGAGGSSETLADKPIVRTAKGELLIPASQLKGRLRHECEKLARALNRAVCESPNPQNMCPQRSHLKDNRDDAIAFEREYGGQHCLICQMFGNPALPSHLLFDDLICTEAPENLPEVMRPGVTLNRRRRTAEDKKLFLLETSPANANNPKLEFRGEIHILCGSPSYTKALLLAALKHIHALGGSKSGGLGWLQWKSLPKLDDDTAWDNLLI